ncbi:MAG: serine protease [Cyanobacteriota bacterium]|nr:serine protease [Cyanobacteriota bacterium]
MGRIIKIFRSLPGFKRTPRPTKLIHKQEKVVENQAQDYTIRTSKGNDHPVIPDSIQTFRQDANGLDLAIVQFESSEEYAVAPVSDSDEATISSGVYISGYPLPAMGSPEREYTFTNGQIANVRSGNPRGYNLRYDAVTRRGMSGSPVFDVSGRVIGIHGEGDTVGAVQTEGGSGAEEIKTGIIRQVLPVPSWLPL